MPVPVLDIQVPFGGVGDEAEWDGLGRRLSERSSRATGTLQKVNRVDQWRVPG